MSLRLTGRTHKLFLLNSKIIFLEPKRVAEILKEDSILLGKILFSNVKSSAFQYICQLTPEYWRQTNFPSKLYTENLRFCFVVEKGQNFPV